MFVQNNASVTSLSIGALDSIQSNDNPDILEKY